MTDRKEAIGHVTTALVTGAAGIATQLPIVRDNPNVQMFVAMYAPLLGVAATNAIDRAIQRRTVDFSGGLVDALGGDPHEAGKRIEELADSEDNQDLMLESFRRLMNAVSVDVAPSLGYLAGQYTRVGRKADSHFRSLGRLLCDLEPGDLAELKRIIRHTVQQYFEDDFSGRVDIKISWQPDESGEPPTIMVGDLNVGPVFSADRLIRLLKREGFAWHPSLQEIVKEELSTDDVLTITSLTARRILSVIDPEFAKERAEWAKIDLDSWSGLTKYTPSSPDSGEATSGSRTPPG